jgi:hypothetical protein
VNVACESEGVVIVRITFPTFGVPTATTLNGTVKFAKALPSRPERTTAN